MPLSAESAFAEELCGELPLAGARDQKFVDRSDNRPLVGRHAFSEFFKQCFFALRRMNRQVPAALAFADFVGDGQALDNECRELGVNDVDLCPQVSQEVARRFAQLCGLKLRFCRLLVGHDEFRRIFFEVWYGALSLKRFLGSGL